MFVTFSSYLFNYSMQSRESPGLIPVTVKQISEASHSGEEKANFVINGVDITNVYFLVFFPTVMYYLKKTTRKRCRGSYVNIFGWFSYS